MVESDQVSLQNLPSKSLICPLILTALLATLYEHKILPSTFLGVSAGQKWETLVSTWKDQILSRRPMI